MDSLFDIEIPRSIGRETPCTIAIHDPDLLKSDRHFIRLDLYPLYSPNSRTRRHGYWDIPLTSFNQDTLNAVIRDSEFVIGGGPKPAVVKAARKGTIKFEGYAILHASLRERGWIRPRIKALKSSSHVLRIDDRDLPLEQMYVPVTDRCNLRCTNCPKPGDNHLDEPNIEPQVLQSLLDASPHVFSVLLLGTGEPLMHEEFGDIVQALRKRLHSAAQMGTTTNGLLLRSPLSDRLIAEGIDWITVSLGGATAQTHERDRPGSDFKQILENVRHVVRRRGQSWGPWRAKPVVQATYRIAENTVGEMDDILHLAKSLGLDAVLFSHPEDHRIGKVLPLSREILATAIAHATETAGRLRLPAVFPRVEQLEARACPFMQSHYLWLTGEVVACCRMHPQAPSELVRVFGNIRKEALLGVWNSAEYRKFRTMVLAGDFPEVCHDCDYAAGLTG